MPQERFPFWPFFLAASVLLAAVGALNWAVDPLWYSHGNRLTGRNFPFNERIQKVNLLARTRGEDYDCLILGSSRVTALHAHRFAGQRCFNFALKGAESPELLAYGRYAKSLGLQPKTVYVGVDDFNFVVNKVTERRSNPQVSGTPDFWHAFFSADVLLFSAMTLANVSPDAHVYYDANFESREFNPSSWHPQMEKQGKLSCDLSRVAQFRQIRALFPQARVIAYAPLMSPWYLLNSLVLRGVLDCETEAFHQISESYDSFLDFGVPNSVDSNSANTYDGAHFSPQANDAVVDQLIGRRSDLAIEVKDLPLDRYRAAVQTRLRDFVERNALQAWWPEP